MMRGKRKPVLEGDTRARCEYEVRRGGRREQCGRLAKAYDIRVNGQTLGTMKYCFQHVQSLMGRLHVEAVNGRAKTEVVLL